MPLTYAHALRGTARVKPLLWVALLAYIVVGCPVILWFAKGLEMHNVGVYYSFSIALIVAAVLLWQSYRRAVAWLERQPAPAEDGERIKAQKNAE